jgi:hypothetical protein
MAKSCGKMNKSYGVSKGLAGLIPFAVGVVSLSRWVMARSCGKMNKSYGVSKGLAGLIPFAAGVVSLSLDPLAPRGARPRAGGT